MSAKMAAADPLLYEWMSSFYNNNRETSFYTENAREEERRRRVNLGQFVMQRDAPGGSKQFRVFPNIEAVYAFLLSSPLAERTFYETIFDVHPKQKPYFDIDIIPQSGDPMDDQELLSLLLTEVKRVVGPDLDLVEDISVFSSHAADGSKKSYHIVLSGYYVRGNVEALNFAKSIRDGMLATTNPEAVAFITKAIDLSVYKKLQQFRMLGCTKLGRNRYKTVVFEYNAAGRMRQRSKLLSHPQSEFLRSLITHVNEGNAKYLEPACYTKLLDDPAVLSADQILVNMTLRALCSRRRRGVITDETATLWMKDPLTIVAHVIDAGHLHSDLAGNCRTVVSSSRGGALIPLRSPPSGGYWCIICERRHDHENPYITLHEIWDSEAATEKQPRVVAIVYRCRRDPTRSLRLCSMRGGGSNILPPEFTCLSEPHDPRQGEKTVRSEEESSAAVDV